MVSIPNGLPRPFSRELHSACQLSFLWFQSRTGFPGHLALQCFSMPDFPDLVSIPNGLPRPFSLVCPLAGEPTFPVSIPNGLPRPFSPWKSSGCGAVIIRFQSRTGFPGHLASLICYSKLYYYLVSIPNGLPRPFSLRNRMLKQHNFLSFNPERASQAI